jgi:hypothetical protein
MLDMKLVDILGTKKWNIWKLKLMNFKQEVRTGASHTSIGASTTLTRATSLELIW